MRIVKEHEERKDEIIQAASALFQAKGYDECSVNDILNAVGIAKGTFFIIILNQKRMFWMRQ